MLEINDPVLAFDKIMEEMEVWKYIKEPVKTTGRIGYNTVRMIKVILYAFMETGYASLRDIEDRCKVNVRYKYLMDGEIPTYRTFGNFINNYLEELLRVIAQYLIEPPCTERYARWCERPVTQLMGNLLLDCSFDLSNINHDFHHGHRMIEFCISCAVAYIL